MKRRNKSKKFEILGIVISIRVSYPTGKFPQIRFPYSAFNKITIPIFILLCALILLPTPRNIIENSAQSTKSNPFTHDIYNSPLSNPRVTVRKDIPKSEKIVFSGPENKKQVALTFDADMTPEMKIDLETGYVASYYDQSLINILSETGTKATLFLSGMWIESYRSVAEDLSSNPLFELANHTYSHPAFHDACYGLTQAHNDHKKEELTKTQELLKDVTGFDNKLFRFPGGCYSEEDLEIVSATGQTTIQWDVAGQDGFNTDASNIVSNVVDNVKNGSIIVMHMNGYPNEPATSHALPLIIAILREKGYEFVTVSELLDLKKPAVFHVKTLFSLNMN